MDPVVVMGAAIPRFSNLQRRATVFLEKLLSSRPTEPSCYTIEVTTFYMASTVEVSCTACNSDDMMSPRMTKVLSFHAMYFSLSEHFCSYHQLTKSLPFLIYLSTQCCG